VNFNAYSIIPSRRMLLMPSPFPRVPFPSPRASRDFWWEAFPEPAADFSAAGPFACLLIVFVNARLEAGHGHLEPLHGCLERTYDFVVSPRPKGGRVPPPLFATRETWKEASGPSIRPFPCPAFSTFSFRFARGPRAALTSSYTSPETDD